MKTGEKYRLGIDVISFLRGRRVYGRRLEEVTLISVHDKICIVKGAEESFSVDKRFLIGNTTEEPEAIVEVEIPKPVFKKKARSKTRYKPDNSNTLF